MILCSCVVIQFNLFANEQWITFTMDDGLAGNEVRSIIIDPNGIKWFGTDQGLSKYHNNEWINYFKNEALHSLTDNSIRDMAYEVSAYGPELWIGTDYGVSVVGLDAMTFASPYTTESQGIISNQITAVAVDSNHYRYFGSYEGLSVFDGENWFNYQAPDHFLSNKITDIGVDQNSKWRYICTEDKYTGRLKYELDGLTSASPYDSWSGIRRPVVYSVFIQENGDQWFGTDWGVSFHDTTETKRGWYNYGIEEGLISDTIHAIAKDDFGNIWAGTPLGLTCYNGVEWINYPIHDEIIPGEVLSIAKDVDGSMWFGTTKGVTHYLNTASDIKKQMDKTESFQLISNYPNPFNPITNICYNVPVKGYLSIEIFNVMGQKIKTLANHVHAPGQYKIAWNTRKNNALTSGIYLCRFHLVCEKQQFLSTIQLVLLK